MPALHGRVIVRPSADQLIEVLAQDMRAVAEEAVQARGAFHLALSGGGTPEPLYRRLGADAKALPWSRTHVWMVDERRVPEADAKSNVRMIREALGRMAGERLHSMDATRDDASARYEALLRGALPEGRLDFALLGMGADGHTASLFPRSPALVHGGRWVAANDGDTVVPPPRLTLTAPFINAARVVAVLTTGEGKREKLAQIAARSLAAEDAPICFIQPTSGDLRWYVDQAAMGS